VASIKLKSAEELNLMRESGRLLTRVFDYLDGRIDIGVSTMDINDVAERFIIDQLHARPASKGQYGYQYVLNSF